MREGHVVPGAGLEPARGFPQGIFVPLQLSLLHARAMHFVVWTLPLPSRQHSISAAGLGRGRQVSTLSRAGDGHPPPALGRA
jgi:hypothetical protein